MFFKVSVIPCVLMHLTIKLWSNLPVSVTEWSEDEAWDASHLMECCKSTRLLCSYPLEDVNPWTNIKTLLMLLEEHSRRYSVFLCSLFQASLEFISFFCILLIILVNVAMVPVVTGGLRLTSGGKQATAVVDKVLRNSFQKAKTLSNTQWMNRNADNVVYEKFGQKVIEGK